MESQFGYVSRFPDFIVIIHTDFGSNRMPIVSKPDRAQYLEKRHPILYKLCVAADVPQILEFRINTESPFGYGQMKGRYERRRLS